MENDMSMDLLNQNDQRILLSIFHLKILRKTKELDCKCNLDRMMVGKSKGQPYYKD